jgi:hypothetical protein
MIKKLFFVFFFQLAGYVLLAQDLDAMLDSIQSSTPPKKEYVTATFKSSRVINLHSPEKVASGALEFRISHRFGALDGGSYELWGLDQATIRLGLEYGINDWVMVGLGRSTYEKTYDAFVKANLMRQSQGESSRWLSILYMGSMTVNTLKFSNPKKDSDFPSRLAYTNQVIFARKFSESFSAVISPTWVHYNLVPSELDKNDLFAVGLGTRYKLTKRMSLNLEYIIRIPPSEESKLYDSHYNSLSIGVDIETGGHVFQLHFTNSQPMIEKGFIGETTGEWTDKGIHFGFNITREFNINGKKKKNW